MDIFTQKRFAIWAIAVLLILNLVTLSTMWISQSRKTGQPADRLSREGARSLQFIQKELGFSDSQIQQYDQLRRAHSQQTRVLTGDVRKLKKEMMDEIFNESPDTTKAMHIADMIGEEQKKIERITFQHFLDLKELCGKEQVGKLQRLVDEFFRRNPPPLEHDRPMRPPPRENRRRN